MVALYEKYHCSIVTIEEIPMEEPHIYGVIAGEEIESDVFRVSDKVEKPSPKEAPTNLAIIGRHILTSDIFEILRHTKSAKGGEK